MKINDKEYRIITNGKKFRIEKLHVGLLGHEKWKLVRYAEIDGWRKIREFNSEEEAEKYLAEKKWGETSGREWKPV